MLYQNILDPSISDIFISSIPSLPISIVVRAYSSRFIITQNTLSQISLSLLLFFYPFKKSEIFRRACCLRTPGSDRETFFPNRNTSRKISWFIVLQLYFVSHSSISILSALSLLLCFFFLLSFINRLLSININFCIVVSLAFKRFIARSKFNY